MKTKRIVICTLLISTSFLIVKAQDNLPRIVNATSNYTEVNGLLFDYSVGEMVAIETFTMPDGTMLTQGFLQPSELRGIGSGLDIIVFPDMSPNGDGLGHETLTVQNIENYPINDIQIFNRWGNIIFKMSGYDNDENAFKGKANTGMLLGDVEVPDGTYYYILKVFNPNTSKFEIFNGFFVLKRK